MGHPGEIKSPDETHTWIGDRLNELSRYKEIGDFDSLAALILKGFANSDRFIEQTNGMACGRGIAGGTLVVIADLEIDTCSILGCCHGDDDRFTPESAEVAKLEKVLDTQLAMNSPIIELITSTFTTRHTKILYSDDSSLIGGRVTFKIDMNRVSELREAWIPVIAEVIGPDNGHVYTEVTGYYTAADNCD